MALERAGICPLVVNARHVKQVPGRKTDVGDAQWLAILARSGLLTGGFVPPANLRELRLIARQLQRLTGILAGEMNRLHNIPELGLRPVYHRTEGRGDGHLFISVLAYQFVQLIRRRLRAQGISERWSTLRDLLAGQCRVTATFCRADGRTLHVRKATRAEPAQLAIIQALGSDPSPGGIQKMVV